MVNSDLKTDRLWQLPACPNVDDRLYDTIAVAVYKAERSALVGDG